MADLVLIGDIVIDNKTYVAQGDPDVGTQVRLCLPDKAVEMRAVDGDRAADVLSRLKAAPPPEGAAVFLSAGGNDALDSIGLLTDTAEHTFAECMVTLLATREAFRLRYGALLDRLNGYRTVAATLYNPNFANDTADLQAPAEGALSAFNDVIQQEALRRGFDILDLRRIFTEPADYANPIEPSVHGGQKLSQAVADWFQNA